jgi:hypothetical protein
MTLVSETLGRADDEVAFPMDLPSARARCRELLLGAFGLDDQGALRRCRRPCTARPRGESPEAQGCGYGVARAHRQPRRPGGRPARLPRRRRRRTHNPPRLPRPHWGASRGSWRDAHRADTWSAVVGPVIRQRIRLGLPPYRAAGGWLSCAWEVVRGREASVAQPLVVDGLCPPSVPISSSR